MHAWGLLFVILGVLSFVLPLFGRQFMVVTAVGFTGMGTTVAGLAFLAAGIALLAIGRGTATRTPRGLAKPQISEAAQHSSIDQMRENARRFDVEAVTKEVVKDWAKGFGLEGALRISLPGAFGDQIYLLVQATEEACANGASREDAIRRALLKFHQH